MVYLDHQMAPDNVIQRSADFNTKSEKVSLYINMMILQSTRIIRIMILQETFMIHR